MTVELELVEELDVQLRLIRNSRQILVLRLEVVGHKVDCGLAEGVNKPTKDGQSHRATKFAGIWQRSMRTADGYRGDPGASSCPATKE